MTSREQNLVAVENAWWDYHDAEMAEPTGFFSSAPAVRGKIWADVDRRIIQNCPYGRGLSVPELTCLVPARPGLGIASSNRRLEASADPIK